MYDFGLTSEQFWELTPAQFSALSDRHDIRTQQEDLRPAIVASTIANVNRGADSEPYSPSMFMPSYEEEKKPKKKKEASPDMIRQRLQLLFPKEK